MKALPEGAFRVEVDNYVHTAISEILLARRITKGFARTWWSPGDREYVILLNKYVGEESRTITLTEEEVLHQMGAVREKLTPELLGAMQNMLLLEGENREIIANALRIDGRDEYLIYVRTSNREKKVAYKFSDTGVMAKVS